MSDLLLLLDQNSPLPPYEQISQQLRRLIASAQLVPGTFLPSVRQLARDLGVAPNTVVRAYSELERAGWLHTVPRKGVMVASQPPQLSIDELRRRLEQSVAALLLEARQLGVSVSDIHAEIDRQWRDDRS